MEVISATSFLNADARLDERLYCIIQDKNTQTKCYCGNLAKFKRYQLGYSTYCSIKCRANDPIWLSEVKQTRTEKYGVEHYAQLCSEREIRSEQLRSIRPYFDMSTAPSNRKNTILRLYGEHYNSGWTNRAIETRINNGTMVPVELLDEYREYYNLVNLITKKQPLHTLLNFEKRGVIGKDLDPHHIDHMLSIYQGFMDGLDPNVVGHICNLQCIPAIRNIQKGNRSSLTTIELLERIENYEKRI